MILGTKVTCKEGGCCSCVVALTKPDPISGQERTFAINSVSFLYLTDCVGLFYLRATTLKQDSLYNK